MEKKEEGSIVTWGMDTTDMAPEEVQVLVAEGIPESEAEFYRELWAAKKRLLEMPDYRAMNALLDKMRLERQGR